MAGDITGDATVDITGDICLVCVGGCIGDELLIAAARGGPTSRVAAKKVDAAVATFEAVAREDVTLLGLAAADVERLPQAALTSFARAAADRLAHHAALSLIHI